MSRSEVNKILLRCNTSIAVTNAALVQTVENSPRMAEPAHCALPQCVGNMSGSLLPDIDILNARHADRGGGRGASHQASRDRCRDKRGAVGFIHLLGVGSVIDNPP
ncbi:MAG: hypothetical protein E5X14_22380 [Mesorhizobium sp.]|nr:MAG: hypothetical protein E5X14_22380 [Mesorhizobium sp.]